jgi:hypothetical protein
MHYLHLSSVGHGLHGYLRKQSSRKSKLSRKGRKRKKLRRHLVLLQCNFPDEKWSCRGPVSDWRSQQGNAL